MKLICRVSESIVRLRSVGCLIPFSDSVLETMREFGDAALQSSNAKRPLDAQILNNHATSLRVSKLTRSGLIVA